MSDARPAAPTPGEEPPATVAGRTRAASASDFAPAVGSRGGPGDWNAVPPGTPVPLARPAFEDARWSYLYGVSDTGYATVSPAGGQVADANRRGRSAPVGGIHGPFIKPPVWTWEVPLYFWVGGLASGCAFVAAACDAAGDGDSARLARRLALGAVAVAPPLLIADLGRPERFLNMMRIVKPRSPMNMGAWCLVAFSATAAGGVGADLLRRPAAARGLGIATAVLGGYLGSYTGVLLATTAVPLWARSRSVLGPIFICTAAASGAAATRLTLVAGGMAATHPTQIALGHVETGSVVCELALSAINRRRLGDVGAAMHEGRPGLLFRIAETAVTLGVLTRPLGRWRTPRVLDGASILYLGGALAFRYAWMEAGKASAADHAAVVATARGARSLEDLGEVPRSPREVSRWRAPRGAPLRVWSEAVRRASLAVGGLLRR